MQVFFRQSNPRARAHVFQRGVWLLLVVCILAGCGGAPSDGIHYSYHPNGSVRTEYTYQNGVKEGPFREFDERGRVVFSGSITDGAVKGKKRVYYTEGALKSEEEYVDGFRWGESRLYFSNGRIQQQSFYNQDGKLEGLVKDYSPNGSLERERAYKDNELHGVFREYAGHVLRLERYYENGYLQGKNNEFGPDGALRVEEFYKNGKLDGSSKTYGSDGRVEVERAYERGDLKMERTFYPQGWVMKENFFDHGKRVGVKKYFEGERLQNEQVLQNDLLMEETEYSEYGLPLYRRVYQDGVLQKTVYYDAAGKEQYSEPQ